MPILFPMLASGLPPVARAAAAALEVIVTAAADAPGHGYLAPLSATMINIIALQRCHPSLSREFSTKGNLKESLHLLFDTITGPSGCQGVPLPPAAFTCIFPAISAVMSGVAYDDHTAKAAMELHSPVLGFLALHTDPAVAYPRVDMIQLLLQTVLLRAEGALHPLAVSTVVKLFAGLEPSEVPAATESLLSQHAHVRAAALQGLQVTPALRELENEAARRTVGARMFFACHCGDETDAATTVWELYGNDLTVDYISEFGELLCGAASAFVREIAAKCFAAGAELYPSTADDALEQLMEMYTQYPDTVPEAALPATFNLVNETEELYPKDCRLAVAQALKALSPLVHPENVQNLLRFFVHRPLGDLNEAVKNATVQAALQVVENHGEEQADGASGSPRGF